MVGLLLSDKTYDSLLNRVVKWVPKSTLKFLNETVLFVLRRRYLTRILSPHLTESSNILDLGASDGRLAATLQDTLAAEGQSVRFTGCDVHVQPETYIPIVSYDGCTLPFPDNSFDCVLIVDVLHHTQNPQRVLEEAKRVSSQHIVIKDHHWQSRKDWSRLRISDYIGNQPYGIVLPFNFLKCQQWLHLVQECCRLSILNFQTFRFNGLDPCQHVLIKLDVHNQNAEP